MIKKTLLLSSLMLISTNLMGNSTFKINENITVETTRDKDKLTKEELKFPLEITGYDTSRKYIIKNGNQMKDAIEDLFTKPFKEIELNCVFRRHCEMDKDLDFLTKYSNLPNLYTENIVTIKKSTQEDKRVAVKDLLDNPSLFMKGITEKEKELYIQERKSLDYIDVYKKDWIKFENNLDLEPLTNMFIKKHNPFFELKYKKIVSYDNLPRYLTSLVGSKYCNVDLEPGKVTMDKKCEIPLYNFPNGDNLNALYVNSYYVGTLSDMVKEGDKISYRLNNQSKITKYFYEINKQFSQLNLFYFSKLLEYEFDKKRIGKDRFILNENENKVLKTFSENKFKEFLNKNKFNNLNEVEKLLIEKSKEF